MADRQPSEVHAHVAAHGALHLRALLGQRSWPSLRSISTLYLCLSRTSRPRAPANQCGSSSAWQHLHRRSSVRDHGEQLSVRSRGLRDARARSRAALAPFWHAGRLCGRSLHPGDHSERCPAAAGGHAQPDGSPATRRHPPTPTVAAGRPPAFLQEATVVCVDNSEFTRNGDYAPTRFQAQVSWVPVTAAVSST